MRGKRKAPTRVSFALFRCCIPGDGCSLSRAAPQRSAQSGRRLRLGVSARFTPLGRSFLPRALIALGALLGGAPLFLASVLIASALLAVTPSPRRPRFDAPRFDAPGCLLSQSACRICLSLLACRYLLVAISLSLSACRSSASCRSLPCALLILITMRAERGERERDRFAHMLGCLVDC